MMASTSCSAILVLNITTVFAHGGSPLLLYHMSIAGSTAVSTSCKVESRTPA